MELNSRSPQITGALLAKRQILLQGEVDDDIQLKITRFIAYLNAISDAPITLLIDTMGGNTDLSLSICDAIEHSVAEVTGLVVADAQSAGFRILQSCPRRLAYPHARFRLHAPASANLRIDSKEWDYALKHIKGLHEEQLRVCAKRSGQSIRFCREWSIRDKRFGAAEALKLGFIDGITRPPRKKPSR